MSEHHHHHHHGCASDSWFWLRIISFLWIGVGLVLCGFAGVVLFEMYEFANRSVHWPVWAYLALVISLPLFVVPVGIFARALWAYYATMLLSMVMMLLFPIGTVLGYFTIKALFGSKEDFGV
ncbi:MAG: hypothetical protein ACSHYF_12275 [Verrucomicrobiaceae bacterium]